MRKILRGAIAPALILAALQCVIELGFQIADFGRPFREQIAMAYVRIVWTQVTLLIGVVAYAGLLSLRSRASLARCAVAGATVGLLANLASQVAMSALLCLAVAILMNGAFWLVLGVMSLSCLTAAIGGLIVGEIGGGAVGLLSRWRRLRSYSTGPRSTGSFTATRPGSTVEP